MHEVTCTHCGQVLQISPDAPRCSRCGEDLHALIPPHRAANYFYRRSGDLAARGDLPSALAEAERGLAFVESSELRLLAAILSKRMGDMETVRAHVAAIPVDDRLRQEAEWLIRSQPGRHDAEVAAAYAYGSRGVPSQSQSAAPAEVVPPQPAPGTIPAPSVTSAVPMTAATPAPARATLPRTALWAQRAWGFVALVMLVLAGAMGWTLLSGGPDALLALVPGFVEEKPSRVQAADNLQPVTPIPLILPTATVQGTPAVPNDLVLVVTPEPLVEAAPETPPLQAAPFDLAAVLGAAGRTDLQGLALSANVEADRVRLTGVVTNTTDRQDVIQLVQQVSGVSDVYAAELLVRVPATYTVREGDSLWSIADRFYGSDASHVAELFEANRNVLPSAQSLQVGMVLQLPQLQ